MTASLRVRLGHFASFRTEAGAQIRRAVTSWISAFIGWFNHFVLHLVTLPPNVRQLVFVRKVIAHVAVIGLL